MALLESIGIGSVLGSIGQAVLNAKGDTRPGGFAQVFGPGGIIAGLAAADEPPPAAPDDAPVDTAGRPVLSPTIFAIQRAAVIDFMRARFCICNPEDEFDCDCGGWSREQILEFEQTDETAARQLDWLTRCMVASNAEPTFEDVERCFEFFEASGGLSPEEIFPVAQVARVGPTIVRPTRLPGTAIPSPGEPGVIRPRDRPSPAFPEVGPLPGEPGRRVPDVLMPIEFPPVEFPPVFPPDVREPPPPLVEIELIPVRLPAIPRRAPSPEVRPPSPAELEPFTKTLPNRLPPVPTRRAPTPVKIPPTAVPEILIGTAIGTGLSSILRGRVPGARTPSGSIGEPPPVFPPQPPLVPDLLGTTQTQEQRLREETKRKRCEKTRRKNRKICWTGLYVEKKSRTKFEKWYARDCITGEFLEKLERK